MQPISSEDYFTKHAEFAAWLKDLRGKFFRSARIHCLPGFRGCCAIACLLEYLQPVYLAPHAAAVLLHTACASSKLSIAACLLRLFLRL